jgi:hypothetical protein
MQELLRTNIETNVKIIDNRTGEVLVDKANAIHSANMATAIARGLANSDGNHQIWKIKLGNGGTYVNAGGDLVFNPTNTVSTEVDLAADLYNPTYYEIVDDVDPLVNAGNSVSWTNIPASTSTRVIVTAVISSNEAVGNPTDTGGPDYNTESTYFFDELGLFTQGTGTINPNTGDQTDELMLTHLIFSPIEHTGNRELTIVYTLTITVS